MRLGALFLLALAAGGIAAGCASDDYGTVPTLREAVDLYRLSDEKKAMAVAADERGKRVWGVAVGEIDQDRANEKALAHCGKSARNAGLAAQCYLLAVGDRPASQTDAACEAGRISERRCEVQRRYAPGRNVP
jgi:hypothetical protein